MPNGPSSPVPGWVQDENGIIRRETVHRMDRRCRNWDYNGTGTYLITLVLNDRSKPILGHVDGPPPQMNLSILGQQILAHAKAIPDFSPKIQVMGVQLMPDHLHLVLRVTHRLQKKLGEHLRGFKMGCTRIARNLQPPARTDDDQSPLSNACPGIHARVSPRGQGLFADGFVDTILFDEAAVEKALAYLDDNPRRLWEKRAHPELFRVLRDLQVPLSFGARAGIAHFAAIGNHNLLAQPQLLQIQCSRRDFAYRRDATGAPIKNAPPAICTPTFAEKAEGLLAAAAHGAVLVSPCISQGEKEIARRAFAAGHKVITLQNKGFSSLFKPGGQLFDTCAAGNLLMLAPAAWPYLPGHKPITRMDACALNRLAQLLSDTGAAEINYRGMSPRDIDHLAAEAVNFTPTIPSDTPVPLHTDRATTRRRAVGIP